MQTNYAGGKAFSSVPLKMGRGINVITSWLVSYLLVFLLPVTVCLIFVLRSGKIVETESAEASMASLVAVQASLDNDFKAAIKMGNNIAANLQMQAHIKKPSSSYGQHIYSITKLQSELKNYLTANGSVDNFYVFFSDGSVLSSSSYLNGEFFPALFKSLHVPYSVYRNILETDSSCRFWSLLLEDGRRQIIYVCSVNPSAEGAGPRVILQMDEEKIGGYLASARKDSSQCLLILDSGNNVIASSGVIDKEMQENFMPLLKSGGAVSFRFGGSGYVASAVDSKTAPLKYVSLTPAALFYDGYMSMRRLMIIAFSVSAAVGLALVGLSVRYNYRPLEKLLQYIKSNDALPGENIESALATLKEYEFIGRSYERMLCMADEYIITTNRQNDLLRGEFLSKVIQGHFSNMHFETLVQIGRAYGVRFISKMFAAMMIEIVDMDVSCEESWPMQDSYIQRFIISNILEELIKKDENLCYVIDDGKMFACLINLPKGGENMDALTRAVDAAREIASQHYHFDIIVSLSNIHDGLNKISTCFYEAAFAMESALREGCSAGLILARQDPIDGAALYDYPLETASQLANFIKIADYPRTEALILKTIELNINRNGEGVTAYMIKFLMLEIAITLVKEDYPLRGGRAFSAPKYYIQPQH